MVVFKFNGRMGSWVAAFWIVCVAGTVTQAAPSAKLTRLSATWLASVPQASGAGTAAPRSAGGAFNFLPPTSALTVAGEDLAAQERDIDRDHLGKIFTAIQAFRKDHTNDVPDWLSDLFPRYLQDTNLLMSPVELRTGRTELFGNDDPKLHTSYLYEFNSQPASDWVNQGRAIPWSNKDWKKNQVVTFGEAVPIVRCLLHNPMLNLAVSGDIYETTLFWESHTNTLALMRRLKPGAGDAGPKQRKLLLSLVDAETDQPLAGVEIKADLRNELGYRPAQIIVTETNGQANLAIAGERVEEVTVQIRKEGYLGLRLAWDGTEETAQIPAEYPIKLARGMSLGGFVRDRHGKPIPGVSIRLGGRSTVREAGREQPLIESERAVNSDTNGFWLYQGLPVTLDQFTLELSHPDYRRTTYVPGDADSRNAVWVPVPLDNLKATNAVLEMARRLKVQGQVLDSETRAALLRFTLFTGSLENGSTPRWRGSRRFSTEDGQYSMAIDPPPGQTGPCLLRAEAEGYLPAVSARMAPDTETTIQFSFRLRKGAGVAGTVRGPDGEPLSGAEVALGTSGQTVVLGQTTFLRNSKINVARTGDDGSFSFSPESDAGMVIAVHALGYADAPVTSSATNLDLRLKPWGRIEGTVRSGSLSGSGLIAVATAELYVPNLFKGAYQGPLALDFTGFTAETDDQGKFTLERVPPGPRYLWHAVPTADPPPGLDLAFFSFNGRPVLITSGATTNQDLGKLGRSIVGRPVLSTESGGLTGGGLLGLLKLNRAGAGGSAAPTEFAFTLTPEAVFAVDEIPTGSFAMELVIFRPPQMLGSLRRTLDVPPEPLASLAKPIDLGDLELDPTLAAKIGEWAPPFEVATLEGGRLKLSDFRGTNVLVAFWATWCGACYTLLPDLQVACGSILTENAPMADRELPTRSPLVIVGLNLDRDAETARAYAARNGMNWPQGRLGDWTQTPLPTQYGVTTFPALCLIGPDGKLVEANIDPGQLAAILKARRIL